MVRRTSTSCTVPGLAGVVNWLEEARSIGPAAVVWLWPLITLTHVLSNKQNGGKIDFESRCQRCGLACSPVLPVPLTNGNESCINPAHFHPSRPPSPRQAVRAPRISPLTSQYSASV